MLVFSNIFFFITSLKSTYDIIVSFYNNVELFDMSKSTLVNHFH